MNYYDKSSTEEVTGATNDEVRQMREHIPTGHGTSRTASHTEGQMTAEHLQRVRDRHSNGGDPLPVDMIIK